VAQASNRQSSGFISYTNSSRREKSHARATNLRSPVSGTLVSFTADDAGTPASEAAVTLTPAFRAVVVVAAA
jgi:hypothetical protein